MSQLSQFALFVSCVEGSPVTRYGTRTFIGAERRTDDPRQIDYHPDQVIAIPNDEFRRYRREYLRVMREGSLVERTADEWQKQNDPSAPGEAQPARSKAHGVKPHDDPARRSTGH